MSIVSYAGLQTRKLAQVAHRLSSLVLIFEDAVTDGDLDRPRRTLDKIRAAAEEGKILAQEIHGLTTHEEKAQRSYRLPKSFLEHAACIQIDCEHGKNLPLNDFTSLEDVGIILKATVTKLAIAANDLE